MHDDEAGDADDADESVAHESDFQMHDGDAAGEAGDADAADESSGSPRVDLHPDSFPRLERYFRSHDVDCPCRADKDLLLEIRIAGRQWFSTCKAALSKILYLSVLTFLRKARQAAMDRMDTLDCTCSSATSLSARPRPRSSSHGSHVSSSDGTSGYSSRGRRPRILIPMRAAREARDAAAAAAAREFASNSRF